MTNKEFEDKKQEIADYIEHNFRLDGNPKMDNTHKYVIKSVNAQKLVSMINGLQLPKPPTCSTCAYRNAVTDDLTLGMKYTYVACINKVMLHNLGIKFLRVDQLTIEPAKEFGCVFHSSYEVVE